MRTNSAARQTSQPAFVPLKLTSPIQIGGASIPMNSNGFMMSADGRQLAFDRGDGRGPLLLGGYSTADVHDPTEIATYLAGYNNSGFRYEQMCQVIPVDHDSDKYRTFNSSRVFRPVQVETSDYASLPEVTFDTSLVPYVVVARRLATFVPDPVQAQAGANWNVVTTSLDHLRLMIDMALELRVCGPTGLLTSSASWTSGYAPLLAAGFQWNGGANSDPIKDLQDMRERSAQPIRKFYFNERVSNAFMRHPLVREHLRSRNGDNPLPAPVNAINETAPMSEIDYTIPGIGSFGVCAAKIENGASSLDYIMPDVVVGVTQPPGRPTNGNTIATSYNFRVVNAENGNTGFNVRQFRVETRGAPGTMIVVEEKSIPTMTSTIAGGLLRGVIQ